MEGTVESTPTTSSEPSGSSAAVSERPTSAHDALTQAAASLSSEAAPSPETAATGQAAASDQTSALHPSTERTGPIPFDVHHKALENARAKAVDEWRQQHGWAEQVDRASVERMAQIAQQFQQDRPGYARQFIAETFADPALGPAMRADPEIRALAARILGHRQPQPVDLSPDIPVVDEQGQVVNHAYSAARLDQVIEARLAKAMGEKVEPLLKEQAERRGKEAEARAAAEVEEQQRQLETWTQETYAHAIDVLPYFKEYEKEIDKVMATIPGDPVRAMEKAWKQVVGPLLPAKAKAEVLDSFNKKSAAQTVDGSGRAASTPTRPRNARELAAYMRTLQG